jgi:hypothetical protein
MLLKGLKMFRRESISLIRVSQLDKALNEQANHTNSSREPVLQIIPLILISTSTLQCS